MIRQSLTRDDFMDALGTLDDALDGLPGNVGITIRAIGGFALLWRGLREGGYTADIDTITPSYEPAVQTVIEGVGERLSLPPDWLNNDAVFTVDDVVTEEDVRTYDELLAASYEPEATEFRHIELEVASLDTLVRTKAFATCDIGVGRTSKDLADLIALLYAAGVNTYGEVLSRYPWLDDPEFAPCQGMLRDSLSNPDMGTDPPSAATVRASVEGRHHGSVGFRRRRR